MVNAIPPRLDEVEDKERRFYVTAPSSVHYALQQEALQRGTDLWSLGGAVLSAWINSGCPDISGSGSSAPKVVGSTRLKPSSSTTPSSSPIAGSEEGAD